MKRNLLGVLFLTALLCGFQNSLFAALPTITPGSIPTVCAGTYSTLSYSSTNSPTTYNISWVGSPAGLPDVPPGTILPLTAIPIIVNPTCLTGTYTGTIVVTNVSGSSSPMPISITVNGLPTVYSITGGGGYCLGTSGAHIGISNTDGGVIYQLNRGGGPISGSSLWGTGASDDFGAFTIPGTYTITARNAVTLCSVNMSGSTTVSTLSVPAPVTVTGGGTFCDGGVGVPIGLTGSVFGATYQLYRGGLPVGSPVAGIGMAIDFGPHAVSGVYTAIATDTATMCTSSMIGSATITGVPMPAVFSVTGGGAFCAGSYGVHIGLSGSNVGINYKLYLGSSFVSSMPGSGGSLDFGLFTSAGAYTVKAVNSVYGCSTDMSDTAYISLIPIVIPDVTVTSDAAANAVCAGRTTVFTANPVNSGPGPTYTWTVNGSFAGTGSSFSYIPSNSDYVKVVMTSDATCAVPGIVDDGIFMIVKSAIIPTVVLNAHPGITIYNGQYDTLTAVAVNGGVNPTFQWYVNNVLVAGATGPKFISNAFKNMDTVECRVMGCSNVPGSSYVVMRVYPRVGVGSVMNNANIQITPNPSKGIFLISGAVASSSVSLKVTDVVGRLVYSNNVKVTDGSINEEIHLPSNISSGMYILNMSSETDNFVSQIVIE